jgi:2-polyprenyl-3-methyl-5-hydroxy-6-metoxy-1,4-benzoquinol methylase
LLPEDQLFRQLAHAFEGDRQTLMARRRRWVSLFKPGERVLDLGCGDGFFMELLREGGVDAFGVEVDAEKARLVEQNGLHGFLGSFEEFFAVAGKRPRKFRFDGVMLGHVIEHLRPLEAVRLVRKSVRLLKPGGRLIVITPNIAHPTVQETFWLDVTHERPYPKLLLETMLRTLGCAVESGFLENEMEVYAVATRADGAE